MITKMIVCAGCAGLLVPPALPALVSNGLDLTDYGAVSEALGGADLAIAGGTLVLNTNPALAFGANAMERKESLALHVMFGRRW